MTRPAASRVRDFAARIDEVTPASRDRTVDALRALAIMGVILGHWLVTALVLAHGSKAGTLYDASPLASMPWLAPLSWIFQTLAVFFFVGGYSSARSYRGGYRAWLGRRLARLSLPVTALVAVWALLGTGLYLAGVSTSTLHTVLVLVLDPLWFLGVYAVLTALTPLAAALVRRLGAWAALIPFTVVAVVDAVRFGLGGPAWVGWINVAAGWLVPYLLGIAWARGAFRGGKIPALMLAGGAAATAALVLRAGYPASMVGVNGAKISNLNPPTLAVVTFGIAQVGLALLLREPLARWMRRPGQPVGDDPIPVESDRVPHGHHGGPAGRPTARTAYRAHHPGVDRRADRLAAGLRRRARRLVDDLPAVRAGAEAEAARPRRRWPAARGRARQPGRWPAGVSAGPPGCRPPDRDIR